MTNAREEREAAIEAVNALRDRAEGLATCLNAANEAFDKATAEVAEWRTRYLALYAAFHERGVAKRSYHARAMKAENTLTRIFDAYQSGDMDSTYAAVQDEFEAAATSGDAIAGAE